MARRKKIASKSAEQSGYHSLERDNQVRANDTRVLIGTDDTQLPSAVIPPNIEMGSYALCPDSRILYTERLGPVCSPAKGEKG